MIFININILHQANIIKKKTRLAFVPCYNKIVIFIYYVVQLCDCSTSDVK